MFGLGITELVIAGVVLLIMSAGLGLITFVAVKLAGIGKSSSDARRIADLERQVADLQCNQNHNTGN